MEIKSNEEKLAELRDLENKEAKLFDTRAYNAVKKTKSEIVKQLLRQDLQANDEQGLIELLVDNPISIDIEKEEENNLTFGEKIADRFSELAGSWGFILIFGTIIVLWIIINTVIMADKPYDAYPFILLNLILSCVAALQAPIIMMSQNRQGKKDSLRNHNDYRIDLKSELMLEDLHHKIEIIIKNQNRINRYIDAEELKKSKIEKGVNENDKQ